jgi:3-hydroxyisobutyrate dehydrogenase
MPRTNPKTYEPSAPTKVAFIGLGVMGYPMAGHLALAGHHVTVYNRNPAKAKEWCAEFPGHASAATPREAAQGADMVFCCVGNDNDLRAVMLGADGALAGTKSGAFADRPHHRLCRCRTRVVCSGQNPRRAFC